MSRGSGNNPQLATNSGAVASLSISNQKRNLGRFDRIIFNSVIASAGRHQTCLPNWRKELSGRVYARYASSEILRGSKVTNFLGHFWLGIFIQDNLPMNLKQEVQPVSQLLSGTERRNDQFSRLKVYIQKHAGCCCFYCFSM